MQEDERNIQIIVILELRFILTLVLGSTQERVKEVGSEPWASLS